MSSGVNAVVPQKIGPYSIRGTVGEGAFSVVKLAFHEDLQQYFACKIVPKSRLSTHHLEKRFEYEIRINQQMHHPGVVGLIEIMKDNLNYYIFMEFCPNGELFQYIVDRGRLKEDEARLKIRQVLETLKYIHDMGVTHRDLKPENILIDQYGQLKISDFGLSRFFDQDGMAKTPCGSPCYASPECISGKPYDGKTTDLWSCGVILYAMVTGQLPWTKRNQTQLFEQIRRGEYSIPSFVSHYCSEFIRGLMCVDNKKRLTVEQALVHPWLAPTRPTEFLFNHSTTMISLKQVDRYFNKEESFLLNDEVSVPDRNVSLNQFQFDAVLKQINVKKELKIRRRSKTVSISKEAKASREVRPGSVRRSSKQLSQDRIENITKSKPPAESLAPTPRQRGHTVRRKAIPAIKPN